MINLFACLRHHRITNDYIFGCLGHHRILHHNHNESFPEFCNPKCWDAPHMHSQDDDVMTAIKMIAPELLVERGRICRLNSRKQCHTCKGPMCYTEDPHVYGWPCWCQVALLIVMSSHVVHGHTGRRSTSQEIQGWT